MQAIPSNTPHRWIDRINAVALETAAPGAHHSLVRLLRAMAVTEVADRASAVLRQAGQLEALLRHAAVNSPFFAQRLRAVASRGAADSFKHVALGGIPVLSRRDVVAAGDSLCCRKWPKSHGESRTTATSGSTGEPLRVRRTKVCQSIWMANTLREHLWHDRDFERGLMVIRFSVESAGLTPSWGRPASLLFRTGPGLALPANTSVDTACRQLLNFAPGYLLAPPSTLGGMCDWFEEHGQEPQGLAGVRTFSETVTPQLRERIGRVLGAPVQDVYSSQELGIIAIQCPVSSSLHTLESLVVEVLSDEGKPCAPGETGRVVVTDLVNYATPLIRYEIGDCAEVGAPCDCGRTLPVLKRVLGRLRNLVVFPDGSRHWPLVGFAEFAKVIPVRQFQFVQHSTTLLEARLTVEGRATPEQEQALTRIIQRAIGHAFEVRFVYFEQGIPRGPGGKFEEFISHVG
jgi:phenylacetate-CoA ligase